jgi:hypothetical protein
MSAHFSPPHHDIVRKNTCPKVNAKLDRQAERNIAAFANKSKQEIEERLEELTQEWDIERFLQVHATLISLTGCGLAAVSKKTWIAVPVLVSGFLLNHAVRGWCPPLSIFRRLGARTRGEIDAEIYALKILHGDFNAICAAEDPEELTEQAIHAVSA